MDSECSETTLLRDIKSIIITEEDVVLKDIGTTEEDVDDTGSTREEVKTTEEELGEKELADIELKELA